MQTIYVEQAIEQHPRVQRILNRFKKKKVILCQHYGEVFNRKQQNFRLQKKQPALILAEKKGRKVLPTPVSFGIGGMHNYYFSHLLNCPFDCEYCFLQGMYQSAHHVLFVNFEDFMQEIDDTVAQHHEPCYFFSGYDGDSLALEPVSGFLSEFIPFFQQKKQAFLELRTKSANIKALLKQPAIENCIVAFSLNPSDITEQVEHKTASTAQRLKAIAAVADHGYPVGIRLDPLIYCTDFKAQYSQLIDDLKAVVKADQIHSISLGAMRFPQAMFDKIQVQHPHSKLLNHPLVKNNKQVSYADEVQTAMTDCIKTLVTDAFANCPLFSCHA